VEHREPARSSESTIPNSTYGRQSRRPHAGFIKSPPTKDVESAGKLVTYQPQEID
jgi:hypothetical protein